MSDLVARRSWVAPRSHRLPETCLWPSEKVVLVSWHWFWHSLHTDVSVVRLKRESSARLMRVPGAPS